LLVVGPFVGCLGIKPLAGLAPMGLLEEVDREVGDRLAETVAGGLRFYR
jgi:hypothetical protein